MPAYPPISKQGYEAICKYLDQALAHARDPNQPEPDTSLLLIGLPQGSILSITPDLGLQVKDTGEEGQLRTPRNFDPPAIALIRLLLAGGGSTGLNRKDMNTPNRKDYPHVRWSDAHKNWKISLLRLIADTLPGNQTPAASDHYSLRRADIPEHSAHRSSIDFTLDGQPTKSPYLGRRDAIGLALRVLSRNCHRLEFDLPTSQLEQRIRQALALLDLLPLRSADVK
jgi:hypothetical protein